MLEPELLLLMPLFSARTCGLLFPDKKSRPYFKSDLFELGIWNKGWGGHQEGEAISYCISSPFFCQ